MIANYEEQVYAGVLGKVIGVYMGRPFEGWSKERLEEKWGLVNRYVHEEQGVPLVVSDDDISGTFTFVRALEDSGLYAETPAEAFGEAWLNYVVEGKSVFWWGGAGTSTEHTAYLRLKQGMKAPRSGSIAVNGRVVAEQIGAQIFIDAFGLVLPGEPRRAAALARKAASVSHDGEAVFAAMVVAAMVSAAFVEKDMERLLDIGISVIPADSLIAQLHRDVRAWCRTDGDWRTTYTRIFANYGPSKFWGGPHVVPNHALMVLAWCYAPEDFHLAQAIVNTAGWDTDCNAGNVGALMGVKVGLPGINAQYDFQSPFADRMLMPTAEGTRGVTDVLAEALHLARLGRRLMGWEPLAPPKDGAAFHFEMPGALHGFMSEERAFDSRGAALIENVAGHSARGTRAMHIRYRDLADGRTARVSTPLLPVQGDAGGPYLLMGTPRLYPGMSVTLQGSAGHALCGEACVRLFVRYFGKEAGITNSAPATLLSEAPFTLSLQVPDTGRPVQELGIEIAGRNRAGGELFVDSIAFAGVPKFSLPDQLPLSEKGEAPGWISSMRGIGHFNFIAGSGEEMTEIVRDEGTGVLVTGTTEWTDYTFTSKLNIHMADCAGIIARYQGLRRYLALVQEAGKLRLIRQYYGQTVLGEIEHAWETDAWHTLALHCQGERIIACCDGAVVLEATDDVLGRGGAGYLCEMGKIGVREGSISPSANKIY